tara:strand:+ start:103 stop:474 length:372 start_codon:yes stop_codon:yes gene_type:complete
MKTILISILILFSINGFAFNWKKVIDSVDGESYYVDVDNIKKHNGLVYYWFLVDLPKLKIGDHSLISRWKVDCGEEKQTILSHTYYSQAMGKGRITFDDTFNKINYPKPNTVGHTTMKFVCDY